MKRFKNILYVAEPAVDQASAFERTASLVEKNQAKLTIIDVIPSVRDKFRNDTIKFRRRALESLIEPFRNRLTTRIEVLTGKTFLQVVRAVLRNSHDLVMKAAENPDYLKRPFGSDDKHLLRKCPCPVWLMKTPEKSSYKCIMAAVDFDPLEPAAAEQALNLKILELASSLALSDLALLHLVHAWEAYAETSILARSGATVESIASYLEKERTLHQRELSMLDEMLRNRIGADAYNRLVLNLHLPKGPAKKMIAMLAARLHADLVVMGTIARTGIAGLIIGNTAEAILDQLSCSVLAIKPSGFETPVKLDA
jgi:nucleotide-binding universal stress UspA family protein